MTRSRGLRPKRHYWTEAQLAQLRALYPDHRTAELEAVIGRSARSLYEMARKLGIRKSAAFLASGRAGRLDGVRGGATRFKAGHVPANKGLRRPGYAPGRMAESQFKPGQRGTKYAPIGSERLNDGYRQRKVSDTGYPPRDWQPVHVLLWIEHRGPVPAGHAIVFRNGDRTDIRIENLECISRADLMRRNTRHNLPPDLNQVISLRAALVRKINNRSKRHEQDHR